MHGHKESYTDLNLKILTSDESSLGFFYQIESPLPRYRLCMFFFGKGRGGHPICTL